MDTAGLISLLQKPEWEKYIHISVLLRHHMVTSMLVQQQQFSTLKTPPSESTVHQPAISYY